MCVAIFMCLTTPQTQTSQAKFREGWAQYLTTNWSPLEDELTLFISRRKAWTWMSPVSVIGKMEGGTFRNTGLVATEQIPTSVTVTVFGLEKFLATKLVFIYPCVVCDVLGFDDPVRLAVGPGDCAQLTESTALPG